MSHIRCALIALAALSLAGCYRFSGSHGGGETKFDGYRVVVPGDVLVPKGYRVEVVARGLNYPTAVAFDEDNNPYVLEAGYSYGEVFAQPRVLRVGEDGTTEEVFAGENPPWTGMAYDNGALYVVQGGVTQGGAVLRIAGDGEVTTLVENLPSVGDHHTNGPAIHEGYVYFGVGTATNSGIVGTDNHEFGWLKRNPDFHDIPARDIKLIGENYDTDNPLTPQRRDKAKTGAFSPFNTPTAPGQIIPGQLPFTGGIMRVPTDGGKIEMVAWGLRNPFGLAFNPDGVLFATENSFDVRGSRPVWGAGDPLWRIEPGRWYGWPDFHARHPLDSGKRYKPPGDDPPKALIADPPPVPPKPAAILAVHSSSSGLDFARGREFGFPGEAFVAQFGDMAPKTNKVMGPVGFDVVRVDVNTGVVGKFAVNRQGAGPASLLKGGGLERPISVRFDNTGEALYVVDFGVMTVSEKGPRPRANTGVLWRIVREEAKP